MLRNLVRATVPGGVDGDQQWKQATTRVAGEVEGPPIGTAAVLPPGWLASKARLLGEVEGPPKGTAAVLPPDWTRNRWRQREEGGRPEFHAARIPGVHPTWIFWWEFETAPHMNLYFSIRSRHCTQKPVFVIPKKNVLLRF